MKKCIIVLSYIFLLVLLVCLAIHIELEQNSYYINLYTIFGKNKSNLIDEEIFKERIKRENGK